MIFFYKGSENRYFAVQANQEIGGDDKIKLAWLFGATLIDLPEIKGNFVGPRKEMITPWSTNAVEIAQNMGILGLFRIEEFFETSSDKPAFDPMLQAFYKNIGQAIFTIQASIVLGDLIIDSNTLKAATPVGTAVGQVSSASNFVFNKAITDATAIRNAGASTYAQMTSAITNLKTATTTFTNSIKKQYYKQMKIKSFLILLFLVTKLAFVSAQETRCQLWQWNTI